MHMISCWYSSVGNVKLSLVLRDLGRSAILHFVSLLPDQWERSTSGYRYTKYMCGPSKVENGILRFIAYDRMYTIADTFNLWGSLLTFRNPKSIYSQSLQRRRLFVTETEYSFFIGLGCIALLDNFLPSAFSSNRVWGGLFHRESPHALTKRLRQELLLFLCSKSEILLII